MAGGNEVRLRVPDAPEFLHLAALCALRVGRSVGLDTAQTTTLAADVAAGCTHLLECSSANGAEVIDVVYRLASDELEVDATCSGTGEHVHVAAPLPVSRSQLGSDAA